MMLRAGRPLDAGAMGAILSGFVEASPWLPRLHSRAEDISFCGRMIERGWVRVAGRAGTVEAFLARDNSDVLALYVAEPARRAGLGSALLDEAKQACRRLSLWTFQANAPAQAFYIAQGFDETKRTDGRGTDEGLPDIHYLWERT
jgi:GNAT superfamily N-acetyltransferase